VSKRKEVGSSARTLGKHILLDKIVGRESGVSYVKGWPMAVIDLTAGDGIPTMESGTASPLIIQKHLDHPKFGPHLSALAVERHPAVADVLREQVTFPVITGDARSPEVVQRIVGAIPPKGCALIYNDPNAISEFALTPDLLTAAPHTTTLSTLGCNPSGLKRLERDVRLGWYAHIETVTRHLPRYHDVALVRLEKDDAQWAYLVSGPQKWRDRYDCDFASAFRHWPKGYEVAWLRLDRKGFDRIADYLFLTAKENTA